jgi:hypothetical protein
MNPTTYSVRRGNEVYVYVLGRLVMKRWLGESVSATFHVAPAWVRWSRACGHVYELDGSTLARA